jgi:hypothetical protein
MENLKQLIERFGENNEKVKALKKVTDADNTEIKRIMAQACLSSAESEQFVATYTVSKQESFDENQLVAKLKAMGIQDVIKTVEVVDMELLEAAIYDGRVCGAELSDCKITKEIPKLVVKLKKKEKK